MVKKIIAQFHGREILDAFEIFPCLTVEEDKAHLDFMITDDEGANLWIKFEGTVTPFGKKKSNEEEDSQP